LFSTESPAYGGWGTPTVAHGPDGWWVPGEFAALLRSEPDT
jgi:hypothetical protein